MKGLCEGVRGALGTLQGWCVSGSRRRGHSQPAGVGRPGRQGRHHLGAVFAELPQCPSLGNPSRSCRPRARENAGTGLGRGCGKGEESQTHQKRGAWKNRAGRAAIAPPSSSQLGTAHLGDRRGQPPPHQLPRGRRGWISAEVSSASPPLAGAMNARKLGSINQCQAEEALLKFTGGCTAQRASWRWKLPRPAFGLEAIVSRPSSWKWARPVARHHPLSRPGRRSRPLWLPAPLSFSRRRESARTSVCPWWVAPGAHVGLLPSTPSPSDPSCPSFRHSGSSES